MEERRGGAAVLQARPRTGLFKLQTVDRVRISGLSASLVRLQTIKTGKVRINRKNVLSDGTWSTFRHVTDMHAENYSFGKIRIKAHSHQAKSKLFLMFVACSSIFFACSLVSFDLSWCDRNNDLSDGTWSTFRHYFFGRRSFSLRSLLCLQLDPSPGHVTGFLDFTGFFYEISCFFFKQSRKSILSSDRRGGLITGRGLLKILHHKQCCC